MEPGQLLEIAAGLGVKVSQDDELEKVVYAILDQAAIESASPKKKRTRIAKKETDKVYTVKGANGANLDTKGGMLLRAFYARKFFEDGHVNRFHDALRSCVERLGGTMEAMG